MFVNLSTVYFRCCVSEFVRVCTHVCGVMSNDVLAHCSSRRSDILTHNESHMWKCLYGCLLIFGTMSKATEVNVPLSVVAATVKFADESQKNSSRIK